MKCAYFLSFILLFTPLLVQAQLQESFTDGDFTHNPAWSGDVSNFLVTATQQLQSNGPASTSTIYLSTPNSQCNNTEWIFFLSMNFSPSNANHARIYLMSDQADLKGGLNGYYIRVGEDGTNDGVDLFKQQGSVSTKLIDGIAKRAATNPTVRIRVMRDAAGNWSLHSDNKGGSDYLLEGTAQDNTFSTTSYFGITCSHSATRRSGFWLDDVEIRDAPVSLVGAKAISSTQLKVQFSTAIETESAANINHYSLDNQIEINQVEVDGSDPSAVLLTLATPLTTGNFILTVNHVQDRNGNIIALGSTSSFDFIVPITFGDIILNEFLADESPRMDLPSAEFVELYNTSNQTINLGGCTLSDPGTTATLPSFSLPPQSFVILCKNTFVSEFQPYGQVIGLSTWPALNNSGDQLFLKDPKGNVIDKINYSLSWYSDATKKDGGWTLERINPYALCSNANNWKASVDPSGGTPGKVNSVFNTDTDQTPPQLLDIQTISPDKIRLTFTESMDSLLLKTGNYMFDNGLQAVLVQGIAPEYTSVEIQTDKAIITGQINQVTVSGLADCSGNALPPHTLRFGLGAAPGLHQLLITEIMADETPRVELPEAEFLEIHNPTNQLLSLENVALTDATSTIKLPNQVIFPGEYIILSTPVNVPLFQSYGRTIGTSGLSLNNSGEELTLRNRQGNLIYSVSYSPGWHKNSSKAEGGWSLEMIDTTNPCGESGNWTSSENPSGGTPGKVNSVATSKPDLIPPQALKAEATDELTVTVLFNEKLDSISTAHPLLFTIHPAIPVQSVFLKGPSFKQVTLTLSAPLLPKRNYTLTVSPVKDCNGNISRSQSLSFALPEPGDSLDIIINEVLFNPRTGGVDFVEVYNRSDKYINLKGWQLANAEEGKLANHKLITDQHAIITPKSYLVFTTDGKIVKNHYPKAKEENLFMVKTLPSYPDKAGSVVVVNNLNKVIDWFDYDEKYHFSLIDDVNGVSLERINSNAPSNDLNNWHSAASTEGYATPGYPNSQHFQASGLSAPFSILPKVFTPDDDGIDDFTTLHYTQNGQGNVANVTVFDAQGREVKKLVQNELMATAGFYQWDGTNEKGQKVRVGRYIIYFAIFNLTGKQQVFKETVVVGARF